MPTVTAHRTTASGLSSIVACCSAARRPLPASTSSCPIYGSGEIGMNFNAYGYGPPDDRKWIVVDCGVLFGRETTSPGVDLIMPDIRIGRDRHEFQCLRLRPTGRPQVDCRRLWRVVRPRDDLSRRRPHHAGYTDRARSA